MITNSPLTKNFSLHEMLISEAAARFSFTEQFEPPALVVKNLELLCTNILQPLRDAINTPVHVSSGYRCPRVNTFIGGATKKVNISLVMLPIFKTFKMVMSSFFAKLWNWACLSIRSSTNLIFSGYMSALTQHEIGRKYLRQ